MERLLGKIEGTLPGPLIICLAAIHGNEQFGIHAFRNVYSAILNHKIPFCGKLVGIIGNEKAVQSNRRFIDYDLNRCWTESHIEELLGGKNSKAEDNELLAIHRMIKEESQGNYTMRVLSDLHATSSDKGNFIVVPEELGSHPIIQALQLPVALDLHKYLDGTLLSYYSEKGYLSFAMEGGQIGTSEVYRLHTSGLWEILEKAGAISQHDHEHEDHYANHLKEVSENLPSKVKVLYRHLVRPEDGFRMLPGFHNFQKIHKGQQLAIDARGNIVSPHDGMIFMPLYQNEGEDGFFVVEEISKP